MDAVYPAAASALARGRRTRRSGPRLRHRTAPVTFAEIEEVDEDKEVEQEEARRGSSSSVAAGAGGGGGGGGGADERRRRPDLLDERLDREFAAFRRRRARRQPLREPDEPEPAPAPPSPAAHPANEPCARPATPTTSDAP